MWHPDRSFKETFMSCSRAIAGLAYGMLALMPVLMLAPSAARAQMGSVNNPPAEHLFNLGQPHRLDNGLGTMAERRERIAQLKRAQQRAHRPTR
jgi:hypothetical protein